MDIWEAICPFHHPTFSFTYIWIYGNKSAIKMKRLKDLFWSAHGFISVNLENASVNCGAVQWRTHSASGCSISFFQFTFCRKVQGLRQWSLMLSLQGTKNSLNCWRTCVFGSLRTLHSLMCGLPFCLHCAHYFYYLSTNLLGQSDAFILWFGLSSTFSTTACSFNCISFHHYALLSWNTLLSPPKNGTYAGCQHTIFMSSCLFRT